MSRPKVFQPLLAAFAMAVVAGGALAAGLSGADAAKDRMEHMKAMGAASKAIFDQLKSGAPDLAVVKVQAAKIDASAKILPTWFPAGSGQEAYAKSAALPAIWTDPAGFAAKARGLAGAADKLDAVAQAGDTAALGAAAHDLGGACKACHDSFKAKEKD
jgi:cytochrome c556